MPHIPTADVTDINANTTQNHAGILSDHSGGALGGGAEGGHTMNVSFMLALSGKGKLRGQKRQAEPQ
jgi:hypothetical protein